MVEDRDSERLTDVVDAVGGFDDDPIGMRIGPGTEIGGYVIDRELGHGAMGVVYGATHPVIGKRAAIKILRLEVSRSPVAVERFIQEARAVNQIGHPNIIDIFAYGALPDGRAYHVMDLLVGEPLRARLRRSAVLHPSEAASVIDEIASALMAAHDHGFVHRDLKPDNVFLVHHEGRWPEVKLLDFGLAKLMPEYGVAAFTTKTGVMLGTPEYMSPEQARGIGVDYRTDIYALGIVMFEILAGHRPFPALADSLATLMQHAEEPPAALADTVAGLPDEMNQLVNAMLAKTPEARPSLAAVRTVIKRLRTTQLPTRSVAGAAMASFQRRSGHAHESGDPAIGITASRLGAEAVLPGDSVLPDRRISQPLPTTPGVGIDALRLPGQSQPRFSAARPPSAPELRPAAGSQPLGRPLDPAPSASGFTPGASATSGHPPRPRSPSAPQVASGPSYAPGPSPSSPGTPRPRSPSASQVSGGPPYSLDPSRSSPGTPRPRSPSTPPGPPAPRAAAESLRDPPSQLPPTQRGVSAPPRPSVAVSTTTPTTTSSSPAPKPRRIWLAIAAVLAVAAAVGAVIALAAC